MNSHLENLEKAIEVIKGLSPFEAVLEEFERELERRSAWKKSLGSIVSKLLEIDAEEMMGYEDVRAYGAPTECNGLVARNAAKRRAAFWENFEKVFGCTEQDVADEFEKRVRMNYEMHNLFVACFPTL